jgi:glutamate 5-kinase
MVHADYLFLMTDVDCLYDKNPRTHSDAQAIDVVEDVASLEADVSSAGSALGTGGMSTKIVAARLATSAGVTTVITRSSCPGNIANIINYVQAQEQAQHSKGASLPATPGEEMSLSDSVSTLCMDAVTHPPLHTRFLPDPFPIRDRSFWLLHGLAAHGTLYIDMGAHRALAAKAGLLPAGIVGVEGQFAAQEAVKLVVVGKRENLTDSPSRVYESGVNATGGGALIDGATGEVGRALVNYSSAEILRIKGMQSTEIGSVLGYADTEYVAFRENISLTKKEKGSRPGTPGPTVNA